MRISQVSIAVSLQFMAERFRKKYKLGKYTDLMKPAIFFGCYSPTMVRRACNHRSLSVILWGGTDAKFLSLYMEGKLNHRDLNSSFSLLLRQKHVRHVAISEFITEDLRRANLDYKFVPVSSVIPGYFRVCSPGKCVYSYGFSRRPEVYNKPLVDKVVERLKNTKLIQGEIGTSREVNYANMSDLYRKCFVGLRLTTHDGLPNTVVELGLMGIRCIYNGNLPNAIKWTGVDDIVDSIEKEQNRIGQPDEEIAKRMLDYVTIPDDWLDTNFYN